MRLDELIGEKITIALISSENHYTATLRGAEEGGIWIESRELDALLGFVRKPAKRMKTSLPPKRPTLFIPYGQIGFLLYDSTDLGE